MKIIETVATSRADDLAFRALADIADITQGMEARIVGGQMVGLLLTAYPTPDAVVRRTADADAAITTQVAASGRLHELLTTAGYRATAGNSYEKSGQVIDLLIPADQGVFARQERGGRGFDAAPGLRLVLAADPISARVNVLLTDGRTVGFSARLPPLEHAVVLKTGAFVSRRAARDITDVHNLLQIARAHEPKAYGGWRLHESGLSGARGDTQRALHQLADTARHSPVLREAGVRPEVLTALIRSHVGTPRGA